jgi:putative nucleotidyltransferase with HDIG domain
MLAAIFLTLHATIRSKLKTGLKESMSRAEKVLDAARADYNRRNTELLAAATEYAGLKAAIGLLREVPYGQAPDVQTMKILVDQLREVAGGLDYDFLLFVNAEGMPVVGYAGGAEPGKEALAPSAVEIDLFPFITIKGAPYEGTAVPVNLGGENLGSLVLGKRFDMTPATGAGYTALLHDQRIILTTLPDSVLKKTEDHFRIACMSEEQDCEVQIDGEEFLVFRTQRAKLGKNIQLFSLQSIDAEMEKFMGNFRREFLLIGLAGVLLLLLFSAFGSRALTRPLTDLVAHLRRSERTGRLRADFSLQSPVTEVNLLAEAFNHAADRLEKTTLEFVETMAQALDARDPYTAGHSNRVSANSTTVAEWLGLPPEEVTIIRIGAQLHDIGKIGVPDAVLQKPGKLTEEEYNLIKLHPQIGKRILEKSGQFQDYLPIVELHHEDFAGTGYPYGLKGDGIPLGVRIVHVADVYDAITSNRAYRKAMPEEKVMRILQEGSGKQFDPTVLAAFLEVLRQRRILDMLLVQTEVAHAEA